MLTRPHDKPSHIKPCPFDIRAHSSTRDGRHDDCTHDILKRNQRCILVDNIDQPNYAIEWINDHRYIRGVTLKIRQSRIRQSRIRQSRIRQSRIPCTPLPCLGYNASREQSSTNAFETQMPYPTTYRRTRDSCVRGIKARRTWLERIFENSELLSVVCCP
jgi:hypothetical protein